MKTRVFVGNRIEDCGTVSNEYSEHECRNVDKILKDRFSYYF